MGDEPYGALLPWIVFTVVARSHGDGLTWASVAAIATALALLATTRRHGAGVRNFFMIYLIVAFSVLGVGGAVLNDSHGWLAQNSRAIGAGLYAVIFLVSLAFTPVVEYYTRLHVRGALWTDRRFTHVNTALSLVWIAAFGAIAGSMALGPMIGTVPAYTTFNWVIPIAILTVAMHWTRVCWENFLEDDLDERMTRDPLFDLAVDWHARSAKRDK